MADNITIKDGGGADRVVRTIDSGANGHVPIVALGDTTGAPVTTADGALEVNASVMVGAAHVGKLEDTSAASGDVGVGVLAVRQDAPATSVSANGDYEMLHTDGRGSLRVAPVATATGGATPWKLISAAGTNATSVKSSAGAIYGLVISNTVVASRWLKLYDKSTAPTVGTDAPVQTIEVKGGSQIVIQHPVGAGFATGIGLAITGAAADNDATAVGAGDVVVSATYI